METDGSVDSVSAKVALLGPFSLRIEGASLQFPTRKATSLFAFLILNRERRILRETAIGALWPDNDEVSARRALSMSLWRVRRQLASVNNFVLDTTSDGIKLRCVDVEVDVDHFRWLVQRAEGSSGDERRKYLEEAESVYAGDLLEGFSDEWCEDERRALRTVYEEVLRDLGLIYLETGRYGQAIERLQRLVQMDPFDEDAHRELMRVYYIAGRRSAALSHFASMKRRFLAELQSPPSPSTVRLYEHIRAQDRWAGSRDSGNIAVETEPYLHSVEQSNMPIIGRAREIAQLSFDLDRALSGDGSATLVCGDIGVGKTRLIQAIAEEAKLRGFEVLMGMCPELECPPPYQVLIQALWPRLRGYSDSTDGDFVLLDRLVQNPPASSGVALGLKTFLGAGSAVLNEFFLNLIADSRAGSRPTLLVLEDVHRIDGATQSLLPMLLARLKGVKLCLLLSARRGERDTGKLVASLVSGGVRVLELTPLRESDISKFVEAMLGHVIPGRRLVEYVYQKTGGVPLFVVELLKFLAAERYVRRRLDGGWVFDERSVASDGLRVPTKVLEVIRHRISRLSAEQRGLLSVAAVVGSEVPFEILERLLGVPEDKFVEIIEGLLETHLIIETERGLGFPHESIRVAALSLLSRARLRALHIKIASILELLTPGKPFEIAWHLREAGNLDKAADFFEVSGDRARQLHANEDAARYYSQAISCVRALKSENRTSPKRLALLLLKRCEVLDLTGDREKQAQDIDAIVGLAVRLGDRLLLGYGLHLRSQVQCRMNQSGDALRSAYDADRLFREEGDIRGRALAAESSGLVYLNLRNQTAANRAFRRALQLFRKVGDRAGEARTLVNLGTARALSGQNSASLVCLEEAEVILRELGDKRTLAAALLQKGIVHRYVGECARSEALLLTGIGMMEEIGDKVGQARGRSQLSCTKVTMGKHREGLREALIAMRLAKEARDTRAVIVILNNTAFSSQRCLGNFHRAERHVKDALRMVAENGGAENAAIYYDTMAGILLSKGDYEGAVRWGRQAMSLYRRWRGHFGFVGDEISYRLGLAYLRLGRLELAERFLHRAVRSWRRSRDFVGLIHGMSAVGELRLASGNVSEALDAAREVEKLLRKVDGLEQIQQVYWTQYRVYNAAGAQVAARRALRRACVEIGRQADTLKGRSRRRFLAIPVHVEILREAEKHGMGLGDLRVGEWSWRPAPDPALRIDQRRRAILNLIAEGGANHRTIAGRLGVSERTVESDVAALRREGLIGGHGAQPRPV